MHIKTAKKKTILPQRIVVGPVLDRVAGSPARGERSGGGDQAGGGRREGAGDEGHKYRNENEKMLNASTHAPRSHKIPISHLMSGAWRLMSRAEGAAVAAAVTAAPLFPRSPAAVATPGSGTTEAAAASALMAAEPNPSFPSTAMTLLGARLTSGLGAEDLSSSGSGGSAAGFICLQREIARSQKDTVECYMRKQLIGYVIGE